MRNKSFVVEELRDSLARENKLDDFLKTYKDKSPEIKDLNNKKFWDNRIIEDRNLLENNFIYQDKMRIVAQYLKSKKGNLLDVGFGWGILESKIGNFKDIKIYSVDISTEAVEYAKANLRGKYTTANIFRLPYRKNNFDIVVALDVLEHIRPSRVFSAYSEVNRVLKKGGSFIVSVPINEGLEEMIGVGLNPVGHLRAYTLDIIKAELKLSGFEVVKTEFRYAFQKFYQLKNFIMRFDVFNIKQPNLIIIVSRKIQ